MKILFVTSHWPLAPAYGGQQRVLNIAELLSRFGDISFLVAPLEAVDEETVRRTKREFEVRRVMQPLSVASGNFFDRIQHRLRHEFDPQYMAVRPIAVNEADCAAFLEIAQAYDLVWIHSTETAYLLRISRCPRSVLDVDDLPSRVYSSSARSGSIPARRLLDLRMSWIWKRRERLLTRRFDVLTVCSEDDRRYLGGAPQIHVIPNGFRPQAVQRRIPSNPPRIGFIGKLNWGPNENGAKWFIRDVWPAIKRELPHTELRLVGRNSDGYLTRLGPDITGLGWLEDPSDEIATWSAMVVPIKCGGGSRVKVAEGFARRCPIVATTLGAFGYDVRNGEDLLIAEDADKFALACIRLIRDPGLGEALSEMAHRRFLQHWTWDSFSGTVGTVIQECLARNDRSCTDHAIAPEVRK